MRRTPLSAALLFALVSSPTLAQTAPAESQPQTTSTTTNTLDTLVVTGTRVSDRTVAESQSPIDIITPETLQATGSSELATALARAVPSLNFPRPAISDGSNAVRPAQLRGLAPDQVLVLVNGKRRHSTALINLNDTQGRGSSPVDLNAIPVAAVERVEVLRDGASAQYGSDAIAGVINVVLKGSSSGGSIAVQAGQYSAGDGKQYGLTGDIGLGYAGERGKLHLAAEGKHEDYTNRARPYTGAYSTSAPPFGRVVQRYGDPEIDQGAVSYNTEFDAAEGVSFYSFGTASNRDALSNGFYRPAGDARNNPEIYPDGFLPLIRNIAKDRALVLGMRGVIADDWNVDLSYNYGYNHLSFEVENSLNRSLGNASPRDFYAGALSVTQNVLNLDVNRNFDVGLQYPLTFAFGAEWRGERFNQTAGEPASYADGQLILPSGARAAPGAQVFPGFKPDDAGNHDRNSYSAYIDLEADLTDKFSAGIAARYENYSDFGDITTGKLSARYAFTDKVALRGTVSTGFRAPSLQQQFFQSTATNFIGGVPFDLRTFAVDNPVAVALGSEPLKAEESKNYGLGLVLQPVDNLYITIDAYRIDIDDRIILSENLIDDINNPDPTKRDLVTQFLNARGIFGVTGGRYFTNAVDTSTKGVDIVGTYSWNLSAGKLDFTLGYNYNKTTIEKIAPNPPELTAGNLNLQRIGRVEQGRITKGAPRDKLFLGGNWISEHWNFTAGLTRYGEFTVLNTNPALDQTFGAKWLLDLSATYKTGPWSFTLGGDNVTDEYPDEYQFATSNFGQLVYPRNSPFGFNGAYVYGKIGYKW